MYASVLRVASLVLFVGITAAAPTSPVTEGLSKRGIDQGLYDELVYHFKYATSTYDQDACVHPNGNTLVATLDDKLTDTQGYIARDDNKKEIVVALRGSTSLEDYLIDAKIVLVPFISPGAAPPIGVLVHLGFLLSYNSIQATVVSTVRAQLEAYPGYTIVTTGHSLGGALSSIAAVSLKNNFPSKNVLMYTYGQPRTGNVVYAAWVDSLFPGSAFRSTHTSDGVPTIIRRILGYQHHGIEYWQNPDPSSPETVKKCVGDEDPTCSLSISSGGINSAHSLYYGISTSNTYCT